MPIEVDDEMIHENFVHPQPQMNFLSQQVSQYHQRYSEQASPLFILQNLRELKSNAAIVSVQASRSPA